MFQRIIWNKQKGKKENTQVNILAFQGCLTLHDLLQSYLYNKLSYN